MLTTRLKEKPGDPELNYTLGCIDLVDSDNLRDSREKHSMQSAGWKRVGLASGKFYPANNLLAHAYLVGRWGKPKNSKLYRQNLHLSIASYTVQGGRAHEVLLNKRAWVVLSPP